MFDHWPFLQACEEKEVKPEEGEEAEKTQAAEATAVGGLKRLLYSPMIWDGCLINQYFLDGL